MKSTSYQTGRFGVWAVTGLTLLLSHLATLAQTNFSNNSGITIRDNTTALPYPSVITTTGLTGTVEKVTITFTGLTHGFPDDIDALLVVTNTAAAVSNAMLMSDAGGGGPGLGITNYTLFFDDGASGPLPDNTLISNGATYKPTDYEPAPSEMLPPAPGGSYGTSLTTVANSVGTNPNGTWNLFVQDDTIQDAGSMAGWSVNLWTAPVITNLVTPNTLPAITMGEDTTSTIDIKGVDSDTAATRLTFTATSSNTSLVPNANLTFGAVTSTGGGNGGFIRTLSISPAANQFGTSTITVKVDDGFGGAAGVATATISLTVTNVNDAPTIALGATDTTIPAGGVSTNISVFVAEPGNDPNATSTLTVSSSNESIVSATNVFFSPSPGGTVTSAGQTRVMNITPNGTNFGSATLTITNTDDAGAFATARINVTVQPPASPFSLFANTGRIVINDNAPATPSPSSIAVTGVSGLVGRVIVTLDDVNHGSSSDINVLLVGPNGTNVLLMSHAGSGTITNGHLVIDSASSVPMPSSGSLLPNPATPSTTTSFSAATNQPTAYGTPPTFAAIGAPPYGTTLANFQGLNPNVTWSLYVLDDNGNAIGGAINDGWTLTIKAAPTIAAIPNFSISEDVSTNVTVSVADQDGNGTINVTATSSNPALIGNPTVTGSGSTRNLAVPAPAQPSAFGVVPTATPVTITVIATDNEGNTATNQFVITIIPDNDPPTISAIGKQTTTSGVPIGPVSFVAKDEDNPLSSLTFSARSSNPAVIPNENIVITRNDTTGNDSFTLYPVAGQNATNIIVSISVSDGANTTTQTFLVNVLPAANSQAANLSGVAINDNSTATPYPSTNVVSNLAGTISDVSVSIYGLTHSNPSDISILLQSPAGTNVVLMSGDGDSQAVTNVVLIFDDSSNIGFVPTPIVDGTYNTSDSDHNPAEFPGVTGPFGTSLVAFDHQAPNGAWKLFVVDHVTGGRGQISGWALSIQTAPIVVISGQNGTNQTDENVPITIPFTIGDSQSLSSNWTVSASSSQPTVVASTCCSPGSNLVIANTGGSTRTLTVTPNQNQFGQTIITVTATDGFGNSDSKQTVLNVIHRNQQPTISALADQTTGPGQDLGPVAFTVSDVETAASALGVTASSSDPTVQVVLGNQGSGNWTYTLLLNSTNTGRVTVTVTVTDADGGSGSKTFLLNILPNPTAFSNASAITINDNTVATPYPSQINVSGIGGLIGKVTVKLFGLSHPFPADIDMLLVGPGNQQVMLMSDAGGGFAVSNARLVLSDAAANPLPGAPNDQSSTPITSGQWKPANYPSTPPDNFPGLGTIPTTVSTTLGSPAGPGTFSGIDPTGLWQLYIVDDTTPDGGSISGGWMLVFETVPVITPAIPPQSFVEDAQLNIPFTIADSDTAPANITVTPSTTPLFPDSAHISVIGTGSTRTLSLLAVTNASGSNTVTLVVSDGTYSSTNLIPVTVTPDNDPSVFVSPSPSGTLTTAEDTAITTIPFTITDIDTPRENLRVTATSSIQTVVANSGLVITGTNVSGIGTINGNLSVAPVTNANGSTVITITVTDASDSRVAPVSTSFTLNVTPVNDAPTISLSQSSISAKVGQPSPPVTITLADVDNDVSTLTLTAVSQNPSVIPQSSISVTPSTGSPRTLVVNAISTPGSGTILLTVSDGSASSTATLTVNIAATGLVFGNGNGTITINDKGANATASAPATPYPSIVTVPTLQGTVGRVTVSVNNINHPNPDDIDMLLVGPNGNSTMLMSDAGGSNPLSGVRLIFDDSARSVLPDSGPITSGTYIPTDYEPGDIMPNPAPAGPYGTSLTSAFSGATPTGAWNLYVADDTTGNAGTILEGWFLTITQNPFFSTAPPTQTTISQSNPNATITFRVGDENPSFTNQNTQIPDFSTLLVTASAGDPNLAKIRVIGPDSSGNVTLLIGTNGPATGSTPITIVVRDQANAAPAVLTASAILNLVVEPDNVAATEDTPQHIVVTVGNSSTVQSNFLVTARSSNPAIVDPLTGLVFDGSGTNTLRLNGTSTGTTNVGLTIKPVGNANGSVVISIDVSNVNTTASSTIPITVNFAPVNDAPSISVSTNFVVIPSGGSTGPIPFTISDPESPADSLFVTVTSSDRNIIPTANIVTNGAGGGSPNRTVTITAASGQVGNALVTLTVSDGQLTSSASITVFVIPSRDRVFSSADGPIAIPASGAATPYPSQISVPNSGGVITKATVTLNSLSHFFPRDLEIEVASPSTNTVILGDAGGGGSGNGAVTNVTVTFDDSASGTVPSAGIIANNGTYKPTDNSPDAFPSPAPRPQGPPAMSHFNGFNPNGTWSLYVFDDTPPDGGSIRSWTLTLQTAPVVSGVPATLTTREDTAATFNISINDETTPSHTYTLTNSTSSNTAVVPNSAFQGLTGLGTSIPVSIQPVGPGTTTITLVTTREDDRTSTTNTLVLTVTAVNRTPTLTRFADVSDTEAMPVFVPFIVGDRENPNNLTITASSSNQALVPNSNVSFNGGPANYLLTVVPVWNVTGTTTISVAVSDPQGAAVTNTFNLVVNPDPNALANTNSIVINDNTTATPYPSRISVTGVSGAVKGVTVALIGLTHPIPADIDALLVGPQGQQLVLMSDAGLTGSSLTNATFVFSDATSVSLPQSGVITNGTYKPTDYNDGPDNWPGVPTAPHATAFSAFNGSASSAVGTWSLYIVDDTATGFGQIAGGWVLRFIIDQPPVIIPPADQTIFKSSSVSATFTVSDADTPVTNLTVTGSANNPTLVPQSAIQITGTGATRTVTVTPTPGQIGTAIINLTVSDGNSTATQSFILTVNDRNLAPTISSIPDITIPENTATSFVFSISDPETDPNSLVIGATFSNTNLISRVTTNLPAPGTISFGGSGNNRFAIVTPAANTFGSGFMNISVSDLPTSPGGPTNTTTTSFFLTVTFVNQLPVLTAIPTQTTPENKAITVPLSASDVETASSNLVFSATSGNPGLASVAITGTPASPSVTITPGQNQTGTNLVIITVTDANGGSSSNTFNVIITPVPQAPTIGGFADITVPEAASPVPSASENFNVNDVDTALNNLTFSITSSNPTLLPKANIVITGTGTNRTITVTPAPVQSGLSIVTVTVSDGSQSATSSFIVTVTPVVFTPKLVGFSDSYSTSGSKPVVINFSIFDPDSNPTNLTVTGTSSNPSVIPNSGIVFSGDTTTTNRTVTLTQASGASGTTIINLTVSDTTNSSSVGFIVTVGTNQPPTIKAIADQTTPEDTFITVPFVVSDPDTALTSLKVTATSSNTNLVSPVHITFTGTANNRVAVITPNPNQTGFTIINLTVSDGQLTASQGFILTVTPVPHAPTITGLTNQTVTVAGTARQNFIVSDADSDQDPNKLQVSATSSNPNLIPAQNVLLGGTGTNRVIAVSSQGTNTGSATITVTVTDSTGLSSSATYVVTVTQGKPATLVITRLANNQVRLSLTGTPGAQYALESSNDLKTWTEIAAVTADSTGQVTFTDTAVSPANFYRVIAL